MGQPHKEYQGHKDQPQRWRGLECLHHPDNLYPEGVIFTGLWGYVRLRGILAFDIGILLPAVGLFLGNFK